MTLNAYRDEHVHVLDDMCATCVFRPGNLMQLPPGRLAELVKDNADSALYRDGVDNAVCRGFFDRHATLPLRLAVALDLVRFVPEPAP